MISNTKEHSDLLSGVNQMEIAVSDFGRSLLKRDVIEMQQVLKPNFDR